MTANRPPGACGHSRACRLGCAPVEADVIAVLPARGPRGASSSGAPRALPTRCRSCALPPRDARSAESAGLLRCARRCACSRARCSPASSSPSSWRRSRAQRARRADHRSGAGYPPVRADPSASLTFTVTFFMGLFPRPATRRRAAPAIFAIFTSQAWNTAFSFYQSLRSIPSDLEEVSRGFGLSPVHRFLEARPALRHPVAGRGMR